MATFSVTFLVALPGVFARATSGTATTADEPQYLLSALSLFEDQDLDISDELAEERFLDFHEVPLNPQTIDLGSDGQRLSPHDPLLPLLLALPMGFGGWVLAKITMALFAALTAAVTAWLCIGRFGVSVRTGAAVTTALFCAPPLVGYGSQVYPEMTAALAVVSALAALTSQPGDRWTPGAVGVLAVIALPWLSIKYGLVAAVLAVALLVRSGRAHRGQAAVMAAALAVAGVVYLAVHQRIYGGWTVYAAGDHFVDGEFTVIGADPDYGGRSRRLIGLLVDRSFGLMAWTPAYGAAIPALAWVIRRRLADRWLLASVVAAGWAVATWVAFTMHGWWWPGRQVVSVLPAVVIAIAGFVDGGRLALRLVVCGALTGTFGWFWLLTEVGLERRALIVDFDQTTNPLYRVWSTVLPDHSQREQTDVVLTALWVVVIGVATVMVWQRTRPGSDERGR